MFDKVTRVLIADDHPVVVHAVADILRREPSVQLLGTVVSVPDIFVALRQSTVDVLVTDYSMPESGVSDGIIMLEQLMRQFPAVRVIVYTGMENPAILRAIWKLGVHGLIFKGAKLTHFLNIYRRVVAGERATDIELEGESIPQGLQVVRLSPREAEVLRLFLGRMAISEIAVHLGRSIKTISNQKWAAMRKLDCDSDQALFELYASGGLRLGGESEKSDH